MLNVTLVSRQEIIFFVIIFVLIFIPSRNIILKLRKIQGMPKKMYTYFKRCFLCITYQKCLDAEENHFVHLL